MNQSFEAEVSKCIIGALGSRPVGTLTITADDGCIGTSGSFESGVFRRRETNVSELPGDLYEIIERGQRASRMHPDGPWYRCEITLGSGQGIEFAYHWLADALRNLKSVPTGSLGGLPAAVLRARFDAEVVELLDDYEISGAIIEFVPAMLGSGKSVNPQLVELYGVADWQGDSNNGSLNQYFARANDPYGGLDRAMLYGATLRGLETIGHTSGAQHFREALSVYSHFYERVELVRKIMKLPAIPDPNGVPIVDAYWDVEPQIHGLLARYVRTHVSELAGA